MIYQFSYTEMHGGFNCEVNIRAKDLRVAKNELFKTIGFEPKDRKCWFKYCGIKKFKTSRNLIIHNDKKPAS